MYFQTTRTHSFVCHCSWPAYPRTRSASYSLFLVQENINTHNYCSSKEIYTVYSFATGKRWKPKMPNAIETNAFISTQAIGTFVQEKGINFYVFPFTETRQRNSKKCGIHDIRTTGYHAWWTTIINIQETELCSLKKQPSDFFTKTRQKFYHKFLGSRSLVQKISWEIIRKLLKV